MPMMLDWQATEESISFYASFGLEADFVGDFPAVPGIHARSASKDLVIAQKRGTMRKLMVPPLIVKIFTWLRWR